MSRIRRFRVEKLIRDGVPAMMRAEGLTVHAHRPDDADYIAALKTKLAEETGEVLAAATPRDLLEELADVTEVALALAAAHGFTAADLEATRLAKRGARGGFDDRVFNDAVSAPENAPGLRWYMGRPEYPEIVDDPAD